MKLRLNARNGRLLSVAALQPSQYRKYVKGWNKQRYEELFKKYTNDPKAYRIYLPLSKYKNKPAKSRFLLLIFADTLKMLVITLKTM